MLASVLASMAVAFGAPRELQRPPLSPRPSYAQPSFEPSDGLPDSLQLRAAEVVLDGWAFYARAGGMVVATGESTHPFIYGCDTAWNGDIPFCRIGRNAVKMPNQLFMLVGMTFIVAQDAVRRSRAVHTGPRYKLRDVLSGGRLNLRALVAVLPLINFSVLENGAYANILVTL
jgi:hypothetical protein